MPDFTDYSMRDRTYRFSCGEPLWPFGFGLTYSACEITALTADREHAECRAHNTGSRATDEVIEIYVKDNSSLLAPPNPVLAGFLRIRLEAGEERDFRIKLNEDAFTVVDEEGNRIPGSGSWTLYAGFGAPDARTETLTGKMAVTAQIG